MKNTIAGLNLAKNIIQVCVVRANQIVNNDENHAVSLHSVNARAHGYNL